MEILLNIFYVILFSFLIRKIPFFQNIPGLSYRLLLVFFALKILAGISLILIYTYYYDISTADFNKYFVDGNIMLSALQENPLDYLRMLTGIQARAENLEMYYHSMTSWYRPWDTPVYNDSRVLVRFNALVGLFSFGSVYVHNTFINFLSLTGLVGLYKFFVKYTPQEKLFWLPWGVFLFPGVLFWASGILKEGMLFMAFGLWVYFTDTMITTRKISARQLSGLIITSLLLVLLKPYNLMFWIPFQIAFYLSKNDSLVKKQFKYAALIVVCILLVFLGGLLFPQYNLIALIARKQNDFVTFSVISEAGSLLHTRYLKAEFWDLVLFFPKGLFYVLTRPHIFESYSLIVLMAALENLFVLFMIIYTLVRWDRNGSKNSIMWLALWFCVFLMGFIGTVTPLHGAFVRYKIPALPFLWVVFVHLSKLPHYESIKENRLMKYLYKG